ncbi:MAG TPA: sulfatase, partial [Nitrospiria bacterium]
MPRLPQWISRSLVLIAGVSGAAVIFLALFVYPRPSRLPDPLNHLERTAGNTKESWREYLRLIDLKPDGKNLSRVSPRWEEGILALRNHPDAAPSTEDVGRLQAGIGFLKRAEMEVMDALFAPAPTDLSYRISVPPRGRLSVAMGILPPESGPPVSARFLVRAAEPGSPDETLLDRVVTPLPRRSRFGFRDEVYEYLFPDIRGRYGQWERADLDLSRWSGRAVRLTLSTQSVSREDPPVAAVWGSPVLLGRNSEKQTVHTRPNVIVILVDAMRPDTMGAYGSPRGVTPHMDRLAREGVVFRQARSASVDTRTSETALFTGRLPGAIGLHYRTRGLAPVETRHFHALNLDTLPELFRQNGYAATAFVNNMFLLEFTGTGYDLGFDEIYNNNRAFLDTADLTDRAIGWLAKNGGRPFFMFLNYNSPHGVYRPPLSNLLQAAGPAGLARFDLRDWYRGSVAYVDEYVGVLTTALEGLDLLDDTLIVITSDHGQIFDPEHDLGIPDRNIRTYNRHGYTLYDEEIHVPLIVRLPGGAGGGKTVENPVSHVDLFPTLLDLADLPIPSGLDGRSLTPELRGKPSLPRPVFAEGRFMKAVVWDGMKYIRREGPAARLLRSAPGKESLVHLHEEMYDLRLDPDEHWNLLASGGEMAGRLAEDFRRLLREKSSADLMLNQVRLSSGDAPHRFQGRAAVSGSSGVRIRFYDSLASETRMDARLESPTVLSFSADLPKEGSAAFYFETDPPDAPIRLDVSIDGQPIDPGRLYGGPMGLPGLIRPSSTLAM